MSFAATWMQPAVIILSELMQEQKTKYYMFSFTRGGSLLRTRGHREGSITHGSVGGNRGGTAGGGELGEG